MKAFLLCSVLAIAACNPVSETYRQRVVASGAEYALTAGLATAYARQPRCGPSNPAVHPKCSEARTVITLGQADKAANEALRFAQGQDTAAKPAQEAALTALADAVDAFKETAASHGVK